ncbi:MAG: DUF4380 domain-containing protein [Candidatus Brocadiia bacterium]
MRRCRDWAMVWLPVLIVIGAAVAAGCAVAAEEQQERSDEVTVRQVDFRGWEGSYLLANGEVEVVVVPQVARIMKYAPAGGRNVLWVNPQLVPEKTGGDTEGLDSWGWLNYGGYKLWPAPQKAWDWPPPAALDSGACEVEVTAENTIRLQGQPSEELGIRFDREIRLAPEGSELVIEQIMVSTGDEPVTWGIWEVTQVGSDCVAFVPLGEGAEYRPGEGEELDEQWREVEGMLLARPSGASGKAFITGPPGWLGCVQEELLYVKSFDIASTPPPEPEAPREVYVGDQGYVELEVVGPEVTLQPGESASLTETWRLLPFEGGAEDDAELARRIRAAVAPVPPE